MKVVTKRQFKELMEEYPEGGIVFTEWTWSVYKSELMVTDGDFGATNVLPYEGEVFDWDWNIDEYNDDDLFAVFDNNDILQMIQTLSKGVKVDLEY